MPAAHGKVRLDYYFYKYSCLDDDCICAVAFHVVLAASRKCNGIGFAGHFQTGNGPDYILLRRIYLSTGQLVAGSLQAAY